MADEEQPVVKVERRDAVQWLTIDREPRRNALNEVVVRLLGEGIVAAQADPACRAIVITGAGDKAFCAGADLQQSGAGSPFDVDYSRPRHYLVALFRTMQACGLPIVARVNGHALAGGFGLLCACDMAVASDDALFGTPESKIGLTPMMILPTMLRVLQPRALMEMCITAEPIDATRALALGVVNYTVPRAELDDKLAWLLERTVDRSPAALRLGKQAFHAMQDMTLEQAQEYAQAMVPAMVSTGDAREGLAAFQQKRAPVWR
ncbi:enoyl-CoA hydratase-related protein [Hydrogenophaga sp.]|uniref:enoyl-CoA hydratase-related protein n=1 Tax=Hydrogenophaga sp. TaxID=1904254 RepID=UPI003F6EB25B